MALATTGGELSSSTEQAAPVPQSSNRREELIDKARQVGLNSTPAPTSLGAAEKRTDFSKEEAAEIAADLNDGNASNHSSALAKLGIGAKGGAYTDKSMSEAIKIRALGGFNQEEIERIRAMSQEEDAAGKSAHILDSEKGEGYKKGVDEVKLGELQAPTLRSNDHERGVVER